MSIHSFKLQRLFLFLAYSLGLLLKSNDKTTKPLSTRLYQQRYLIWLRRKDLNQRPSGYEPDELTNCSTPRYIIVCCFISKGYFIIYSCVCQGLCGNFLNIFQTTCNLYATSFLVVLFFGRSKPLPCFIILHFSLFML